MSSTLHDGILTTLFFGTIIKAIWTIYTIVIAGDIIESAAPTSVQSRISFSWVFVLRFWWYLLFTPLSTFTEGKKRFRRRPLLCVNIAMNICMPDAHVDIFFK